jgi:hypothetical protein
LPSTAASTVSVHVPPYACHSNGADEGEGVLRRPVESTTQYLPRLAVPGTAIQGHNQTHAPQQV